jgi:hypothetical protein
MDYNASINCRTQKAHDIQDMQRLLQAPAPDPVRALIPSRSDSGQGQVFGVPNSSGGAREMLNRSEISARE